MRGCPRLPGCCFATSERAQPEPLSRGVPPKWQSHDGKGPEECVRRLVAEGIGVTNDTADTKAYVNADTLRERWET